MAAIPLLSRLLHVVFKLGPVETPGELQIAHLESVHIELQEKLAQMEARRKTRGVSP